MSLLRKTFRVLCRESILLYTTPPGPVFVYPDLFTKFFEDDEKIRKSLNRAFKLLPKRDREAMVKGLAEDEDSGWDVLLATFKEAYRQGTAGTFGDSKLFWQPWDFELRDVQRKVVLIYADGDTRTPLAFGRYYQTHLPDSEYVELEDANHFRVEAFDTDILRKAVGLDLADVDIEDIQDGVRWKGKRAEQTDANAASQDS